MSERPVVLSFGGGVQSSALVALLGRGEYPGNPPQEVWFCDPKNERPQTYVWIEQTIRPYLERLGVPFVVLERPAGSARGPNLLTYYRERQQFPLRQNRQCTVEWKVNVMLHECKRRGWNHVGGVEKHLGISLDELHRAHTGFGEDWEVKRYPLIEARLFRDDCAALCQQTFGAVPVKSGCWFCKYQSPRQWREVWEQRADGRWALAVEWEREVMAKHGPTAMFLKRAPGRTLEGWSAAWEQGEQLALDFGMVQEGACDGGYCMV